MLTETLFYYFCNRIGALRTGERNEEKDEQHIHTWH